MRTFLTVLTVILSLSCARANYQNEQLDINQINQQNEQCSKSFSTVLLCVDLIWEKLPTEDERGVFRLQFYRIAEPGTYIEPTLAPSVQLWMPSMGHGSAPVQLTKIADGVYRVSEVYFVMSGDWEIRVQQKNGKDLVDQVVFPFVW